MHMCFISNKLKEDAAGRYDTYLVWERAIKGGDLVRICSFSAMGLNPMKTLSCIFSQFWN
jgi:hypothetical protein